MNRQTLVFVKLPKEISDKVYELNQIISSECNNDYRSNLDGIWQSHLMLFLSVTKSESQNEILKKVKEIVNSLEKFQVVLGDFKKESEKFIFIDIDEASKIKFASVHDKLVNKLQLYRDQTINPKYLEKWNQFSDKEKQLIKTTGLPYPYESHITIARVLPEELNKAGNLIESKSMTGLAFEVEEILVAQDIHTESSDWEIIDRIVLK